METDDLKMWFEERLVRLEKSIDALKLHIDDKVSTLESKIDDKVKSLSDLVDLKLEVIKNGCAIKELENRDHRIVHSELHKENEKTIKTLIFAVVGMVLSGIGFLLKTVFFKNTP